MMETGTMIVALVASLGWLFLNYRALQSHGLSTQQKVAMAAGWAVVIAVLAYVLEHYVV